MDTTNTETNNEAKGAVTRRQMLKTAARLVLALPMFSGIAQADAPPENWVSVGKPEDFVIDQSKKVTLAGGSVLYVTRKDKETLTTLSAKCTHRGCTVDWQDSDSQFHCPCHGAIFAKSGKNVHGTNREPNNVLGPLAFVPTRQKDGDVQVNRAAVPDNSNIQI